MLGKPGCSGATSTGLPDHKMLAGYICGLNWNLLILTLAVLPELRAKAEQSGLMLEEL